jgi:DNA polymerase-4
VGPVLEEALLSGGYDTVGKLADADLGALRRLIGERAEPLVQLARGIDERPVEPSRAAKSYGEESTFERDVSAREVVTSALSSHAQAVAARLRADGVRARTVTVKMKLGTARAHPRGAAAITERGPKGALAARSAEPARTRPGDDREAPSYPLLTRSKTLPQATNDAAVIRKTAIALWDAANVEEPIRLLGVSVSALAPSNAQLGLFADAPDEKHGKLGAAMDAITAKFGSGAISRAVTTPEKVTPSMRKKRGES